jgi:hypothetical protein
VLLRFVAVLVVVGFGGVVSFGGIMNCDRFGDISNNFKFDLFIQMYL